MKWFTKLDVASKRCPVVFLRSSVKFQGHTAKKRRFWPKLGVSGLQIQFEFSNGYRMTHKAWNSIGGVPYWFSRSPVKFQGHTGQQIPILTRIERFWIVTPVWIHPWLWNDAQSLIWYRRGALLFFKVIHQISRSRGTKKSPFLTVTQIRLHRWNWNDTQNLM